MAQGSISMDQGDDQDDREEQRQRAMAQATKHFNNIKKGDLTECKALANPPKKVHETLGYFFNLVEENDQGWMQTKAVMGRFTTKFHEIGGYVGPKVLLERPDARQLVILCGYRNFITQENLSYEDLRNNSMAIASIF